MYLNIVKYYAANNLNFNPNEKYLKVVGETNSLS